MYDAQGMLQAALHDKNERINVYRLRAEERNYGFHHINSREAKYESWENFDFLDFDFVNWKDFLNSQNSYIFAEDRSDTQLFLWCVNLQTQFTMAGIALQDLPDEEYKQKSCALYQRMLIEMAGCMQVLPTLLSSIQFQMSLVCQNPVVLPDKPKVPCKGDPMIDLEITPTTIGSIKGGRWGKEARWGPRKDGTIGFKPHNGIDLKASLNSPFGSNVWRKSRIC